MTALGQHIVTMTRGEVTPLAHARIDLQDYLLGLKTCKNWQVLKYGGVTRIPGTLDLGACEDSTAKSRLIPYTFSQSDAYALEFSNQKIRFWTPDGVIVDGGSPVEVVSPYLQADLWKIQIHAISDVIYISCAGYQQRTLTRTSDTDWTLALYESTDGPWLPQTYDGVTLSLAGTGHATPAMTSNSAPSGTVSATLSEGAATDPWKLFDQDHATTVSMSLDCRGDITYDFGAGIEKTVVAYYLFSTPIPENAFNTPVSWVIEGQEDGSSDWVVIDTQNNTSDWLGGETRVFELANTKAYRKYRYRWLAGGDTSTEDDQIHVGELAFLLDPSEQTAFDVTASATTGINDGTGFTSDDVGRQIRVMGEDGFWRTLEIISQTSSTVVTAKLLRPAPMPPEQNATSLWQLQAWGENPGWPHAVMWHKGRLGWGRTDTQPRNGWLSVSGDFDNYGTSQPLLDDDGINFGLTNGDMDEILWGSSNDEDLLIGTVGGIRVLGQRDKSSVFSPSNHEEVGNTIVRPGGAIPVWVDKIMVFVDKQLKRLYETAFSLDEGGYVARELTMLAEHIFRDKVRETHFQLAPEPTIWAVLESGEVAVCAYDRSQQVFGVSRLVVPGTSATVESMAIVPGDEYDVPMLVTKRTVNGTVQHRVEKMLDPYRSGGKSSYDIPVYLMAAGRYTGAATSTITGLSYLEGETVGVYDAAGTDLGDATVASGQITVPGGGTVTDALVGLRIDAELETLPPPNVPEDGRYLARDVNIGRLWVDVFETYGLRGGGDLHTELLRTEADAANRPTVPALHTGKLVVPVDEGWGREQTTVLTTNSAYPATIRGLMPQFDRGS